jgi:S-(hydroxymethyl)glutathione dehydrogenase/alcohol dehydrogenase
MKTQAAILTELKKPLELVDLEIPVLKPGQALVEISYSGVCHTQLLEARGHRGEDKFLPHCLGHEGSGIVREVGAGVTKCEADDRVVLSWIKGSGADVPGTVYGLNGRKVNAGAITTFSRFSVISENRLTVCGNDVPMRSAVLLGCAVPTGMGTVINTAEARPGQSIVIFGAGGVGLCAVAGAAVAGCAPIIAVDILADKLALARRMGATHAINSAEGNAVDAILKICPGGTDLAIEVTGRPQVMQQALLCVRNQGGVAVVIGNARFGEKLEIDPKQLNLGKQLRGTWGGDNVPDRDYPRYARLLAANRVQIDPLLSRSYPLVDINTALDDLEGGKAVRPLIEMSAN